LKRTLQTRTLRTILALVLMVGMGQVATAATLTPAAGVSSSTLSSGLAAKQANLAIFSSASYGTAGNGTTDDTAAIQSAITAAANANLVIPSGRYLISSPLNVSGPINRVEFNQIQ
jgi:polygalacturonase